MSRKKSSLLLELSYLPWWVSAIAGICVYVGFRYFIPNLAGENPILSAFANTVQNAAWVFACLFLIPAISSILKRHKRKQLIKKQSSIDTLKETSWSDFEVLVGEAFRLKGYAVQENMVGGADGGIDLTLRKDGKLHNSAMQTVAQI